MSLAALEVVSLDDVEDAWVIIIRDDGNNAFLLRLFLVWVVLVLSLLRTDFSLFVEARLLLLLCYYS